MDKVTVDIAKIENDIQTKTEEIKGLKLFLAELRKYATPATNGHAHKGAKAKPVRTKRKKKGKSKVKVSDFINQFITKGPAETRKIVQAYADNEGLEYSQVYNNVNNALSRQKKADQITLKIDEHGNRIWSQK